VIFGVIILCWSRSGAEENVRVYELYVPKLGISNGSVLEKKKLERIP